jgi:hypothetical protein
LEDAGEERKARMEYAKVKRSKREHAAETAARWFLTVARSKAACARCGAVIPVDGEMVYRHQPREWRCLPCGTRLKDSKGYRPSIRWERAQRAKRQRRMAA